MFEISQWYIFAVSKLFDVNLQANVSEVAEVWNKKENNNMLSTTVMFLDKYEN